MPTLLGRVGCGFFARAVLPTAASFGSTDRQFTAARSATDVRAAEARGFLATRSHRLPLVRGRDDLPLAIVPTAPLTVFVVVKRSRR
jgi:hypothetical protein